MDEHRGNNNVANADDEKNRHHGCRPWGQILVKYRWNDICPIHTLNVDLHARTVVVTDWASPERPRPAICVENMINFWGNRGLLFNLSEYCYAMGALLNFCDFFSKEEKLTASFCSWLKLARSSSCRVKLN